ncbi:MAG: hypothetical protein ACJ78H_06150, partial [Chloroflexota bacterium]
PPKPRSTRSGLRRARPNQPAAIRRQTGANLAEREPAVTRGAIGFALIALAAAACIATPQETIRWM